MTLKHVDENVTAVMWQFSGTVHHGGKDYPFTVNCDGMTEIYFDFSDAEPSDDFDWQALEEFCYRKVKAAV
jgi:hypothetical protein